MTHDPWEPPFYEPHNDSVHWPTILSIVLVFALLGGIGLFCGALVNMDVVSWEMVDE